jgi:hypothetical protein
MTPNPRSNLNTYAFSILIAALFFAAIWFAG